MLLGAAIAGTPWISYLLTERVWEPIGFGPQAAIDDAKTSWDPKEAITWNPEGKTIHLNTKPPRGWYPVLYADAVTGLGKELKYGPGPYENDLGKGTKKLFVILRSHGGDKLPQVELEPTK
jgi:hypothetical protein